MNVRKNEVQVDQPAPGTSYVDPAIMLDDQPLDVVDTFAYLGSMVSNDCRLEKTVILDTFSLWTTTQSLRKRQNNCFATKFQVYQAAVVSCLLYSAETYMLHW